MWSRRSLTVLSLMTALVAVAPLPVRSQDEPPLPSRAIVFRVDLEFGGAVGRSVVAASNNAGDLLVGNIFGPESVLLRHPLSRSPVQCPSGGSMTAARSINRQRTIVGDCVVQGATIGFLRDGTTGRHAFLRVPGAIETSAHGLNDATSPLVVGHYRDQAGVFHGFTWEAGRFRSVDVPFPDAVGTVLVGVNLDREIIGFYQTIDDRTRGFLFDGRTFTRLDAPGSHATIPQGLNNDGKIVGVAADPVGLVRSFVWVAGDWFEVRVGDETSFRTEVIGLTHDDRLVGRELVFSEARQEFDSFGWVARHLDTPPFVPFGEAPSLARSSETLALALSTTHLPCVEPFRTQGLVKLCP